MKRLWFGFVAVLLVSFSVLIWIGTRIYQQVAPIPDRVVSTDGHTVIASGDVGRGQNVWQAMGGMEIGSVWGHGSYVAPDWTADWLHREAVFVLDALARKEFQQDYAVLEPEQQAQMRSRLQSMMRTNTYDPANRTITISPLRGQAFEANLAHFSDVFKQGNVDYAIPPGAVSDPEKLRELASFFFWTSWAASTNRPDDHISYTHNWPHEELVGNRPTGEMIVWTGVSVIVLLGGISGMVWYYASLGSYEVEEQALDEDPLLGWQPTPSQLATVKYFWVVAAMILLQVVLGIVTAHYGVEGDGFYGFPLSKWLPYAVARTWHVQLAVLWIATAWLGAGLFIGPMISGVEPKFQRLGVNVLFGALVFIVAGSMAGEWLSVQNKISGATSFYFGHQGYEYIDLGRAWQIGLFAGLLIWFSLIVRVIWPALRKPAEDKSLVLLFLVSTAAIGSFYAAGFAWGQHTHLTLVEYWRWWVVHLWVEGFFEVFATVVIAIYFAKLRVVRPAHAAQAALLSATIYLAGGIIGTCHHLYFSGTPTVALAFGAVFSALEVVPLTLVAYEALHDLRISRLTSWIRAYRWPIYFFVAVAFWNMVGAGLFGFMINPPIALYYMQGLNTTPVHAHAALFGVYGMLGMGLLLVCLRALTTGQQWNNRWLGLSFWAMNLGLFGMCVLSLLPVGLMQTWAAVDKGYWYARSTEFLGTDLLQTLRWLRVPGDTLFALGAVGFVLFVATLRPGAAPRDTSN